MLVAPLGTTVHEGIAQGDQSIRFTEWGTPFVKWLRVSHHEGELVLVEDGRTGDGRPEVSRYRQHSSSAAGAIEMILDLEVELIDGRLEEGSRCQHAANYVRPMTADDLGIGRRTGVFLLQLAREVGQVSGGVQVVTEETCRDLRGRLYVGLYAGLYIRGDRRLRL